MFSSVSLFAQKSKDEFRINIYVTPTVYFESMECYKTLFLQKKEELLGNANKLKNGLWKIDDTKFKVESMTTELVEAKKSVEHFQKQCEEYLASIVQQKREADEQAKSVGQKSEKIVEEELKCRKMAEVAQADLAEAMPALDEAKKALEALNKKDITEIKSYGKPPMLVEKVLEAVMILRGNEPTWVEAKRQLGDQNFIKQLLNFDVDNISDRCLKKISSYCIQSDFQPEIVGRVSTAAKSLCMWVRAIEQYAKIYRVVEPKRHRLAVAEGHLKEKMNLLQEAKNKLTEIESKMAELKQSYDNKVQTKEEFRIKAEQMEIKLERASQLLDGLSGEKERWQQTVEVLESESMLLVGNVMVASGFVTYTGIFKRTYREDIIKKIWLQEMSRLDIPYSKSIDLIEFLTDPTVVRDWNMQGLPGDTFSIQNGIIVSKSLRWPLLIDPQGQAFKWIKNMEGSKNLKVADLHTSDYLKIFEGATVMGVPMIIENVSEDIDGQLNPILEKPVLLSEKRFLKFGEKEIELNNNFRLYIVTKLSNPHYSPEISSKTNIVNFAVKEQGLENQLLGVVIRKERPELEEQKDILVRNIANGKKKIKQLEDDILRLLNEAKGSLLDDEQLLLTLQTSKATSQEVHDSLMTSEATEAKIDETREGYRLSAERASILFFALNDVGAIDPMYKFSLESYIDLFNLSIDKSHKSSKLEERIAHLNEYHTYSVYRFACRGIFEKHKLIFSFHMCIKILKSAGKINTEEYNFFLYGGIVLDRDNQMDNPCNWLPNACWDNITELDKLTNFHGLTTSFEQYQKDWNTWYTTAEPETSTLPGEWDISCNELQRILIVRSIRPDRVSFCVTSFITNNLGSKYIEPPILNFKSVVEESTCKTPLIFILSPGVDPTNDLIAVAESKGMFPNKFCSLSLGQGQSYQATHIIKKSIKEGLWVFLANCHLSINWMPSLDKLVKEVQSEETCPHPDFRLWLSSSPDSRFPISILQIGIKMTTEPPKGLKANMKRMYSRITDHQFIRSKHPEKYKKLLFCLIFFHSILIERRKFSMLGWNSRYNFEDSDFEVSEGLLNLYLDEYEETPWEALKFLVSSINYGGHVTDDWDRRLINVYISDFFCEDVLTSPSYKMSSLPSYYVPRDGSLNSYREYVSMLPNMDHPEVFGQHTNADITSQTEEAKILFDTLLSMQAHISIFTGDKEEKVLETSENIKKLLPESIDYSTTEKIFATDRSPLKTVLLHEILWYNKLLDQVKEQLNQLEKGIKGLLVMSPELEEVFKCLYEGKVPNAWQKVYPSQKLLYAWTRDLVYRVEQFQIWASTAHSPKIFWFSGFIHPIAFLNAVLQTFSRNNGISMDLLSWDFSVMTVDDSNIVSAPKDGVLVKGLYLQGAGWDIKNSSLIEADPMQLVCSLPTIHFKPVELKRRTQKGIYSTPCYYCPNREGLKDRISFVVAIDLKSGEKSPEHWAKRGTAVLMSLDS
ncbi:hypothetical protein HELRODRAFT_67097 [Helobdella robusta]|uniref:Dynein heavy chain 2, axonemal n=1 Tax=Helobdella robusta TaxID=6412 RepID=T1FYW3_HELRO|nr:hypothetical protein HELRODRAFT_67097 [Helobdella robusta]ESN99364.1 hypothetical protein HELRODRAFT_67097 [Helobdella robusta]